MLLKINQFKEFDLISLRSENQFRFSAVETHLKGNILKGQVQNLFALPGEFFPPFMVPVFFHKTAQFRLLLRKGRPCFLCPLPEIFPETGQGDAVLTAADKLLRVLIPGKGLQRSAEIEQPTALLVQVVIGIAHAEIPHMIPFKICLVGLQQGKGAPDHGNAPGFPRIRQIVVRPRQLAVRLRGARLIRDGFQCVDDLLIFIPLIPNPALFQQLRIPFPFRLRPVQGPVHFIFRLTHPLSLLFLCLLPERAAPFRSTRYEYA